MSEIDPNKPVFDAEGEKVELDYDEKTTKGEICVKIICLGDSAVGKSRWAFFRNQMEKLSKFKALKEIGR